MFNSLVAPLPKGYCDYFKFVSLFCYFWAVFIGLSTVYSLLIEKEKFTTRLIIPAVTGIISMLVMYFVNRLLYNMCIGSGSR